MTSFVMYFVGAVVGVVASYMIYRPEKQWQDGYDMAKEFYSNWNIGFDTGFKSAEKLFKDYEKGFGDGFEAGWNSALDKGDEE